MKKSNKYKNKILITIISTALVITLTSCSGGFATGGVQSATGTTEVTESTADCIGYWFCADISQVWHLTEDGIFEIYEMSGPIRGSLSSTGSYGINGSQITATAGGQTYTVFADSSTALIVSVDGEDCTFTPIAYNDIILE